MLFSDIDVIFSDSNGWTRKSDDVEVLYQVSYPQTYVVCLIGIYTLSLETFIVK